MPKIGVCGLFTKASDALAPTLNLPRNLSASMQDQRAMADKLGPNGDPGALSQGTQSRFAVKIINEINGRGDRI